MFELSEIIKAVSGSLEYGPGEASFTGCSTDSRKVKEGELFIAIKGPRFDGHDFIDTAVRKGARGVIISDGDGRSARGACVIRVKDTTSALGDMAAYHRGKFRIPVIGITGSNGKTTVKELISHILGKRYRVLSSAGTENNHIGLPHTLLSLNGGHEIAVLEIGGNHLGEIGTLAGILRPSVGVITNIGQSHLEFLKDKEGVFKMKSELIGEIDRKGILVINGDDDMLSGIRTSLLKATFGLGEGNDFRATNIHSSDRISFVLNNAYPLAAEMFGRHNVYNILAAAAVATRFDMNIADIREALSDFRVPKMRMERRMLGGITFINDAYNSNPQSLRFAIRTLSELKTAGKKILVSGDMYELGAKSRYYHDRMGRMIARSSIDTLITVGDMSKVTAKAAGGAGMTKKNLWPCAGVPEASALLKRIAKSGDTVLIKGSRAMGMEKIIEGL